MTEQKLEEFLKENQTIIPGLVPVLQLLYESGALTAMVEAIKVIANKTFTKRKERRAQKEFLSLLSDVELSVRAAEPWVTVSSDTNKDAGYSERTEAMDVNNGVLLRTIIIMDNHPAVDMQLLEGISVKDLKPSEIELV